MSGQTVRLSRNVEITSKIGLRVMLGLVLLALICAIPVNAQSQFGSTAVGSGSLVQMVTVGAQSAGSVSSVAVLTLGAPNLDFQQAAGGSCAGANFTAPGQQCRQAVAFAPKSPGLRTGAVLLLDSAGNVLGSTLLEGAGVGGLAVLVRGNFVTLVGDGGWAEVGDGGLATLAELNLPASVAVDGNGNVYIADSMHQRIRMISSGKGAVLQKSAPYPAAGVITTVAGNGTVGYDGDGGVASGSGVRLNAPSGLALDGAGNLFIADTGNNVVRVISAATGVITTVAGTGKGGNSGDGGPATAAALSSPGGVTVDPAGNLFIADTGNEKIRAVCASSGTLLQVACPGPGVLVTIAGNGFKNANGSGGFAGDGGPAVAAELSAPYAVAFDAAGNMYIPDSANNRVRMVTSAGVISTFAGSGPAGLAGDGGPAAAARLATPSALAVDAAQNLYISDSENQCVRKVNASTGTISTVVRDADGGDISGGTVHVNYLYGPRGITLDSAGNLYVADYYYMRVHELQTNVGLLDFTATPVRQSDTSSPSSITVENDGNAPLTLSAITAGANAQLDSADTTCSPSSPLPAGQGCSVAVEFAPTSSGNPLLGQMTVTAEAVDSPLTIVLAGDATAVNSTTVTLQASKNPASFGQAVTLAAKVQSGTGTGALNGTLSFYDGTTLLDSGVSIDGAGTGEIIVSTLSVGAHALTAVYSGDSKHFASTSPVINAVVNEPTATTLTVTPNPVLVGSTVKIAATVAASSGNVTPDGHLQLLDGANTLATLTLDPSGSASYSTSSLQPGAHSLTAVYAGDAARFILGSTSAVVRVSVQASTTTSLSTSATPAVYGSLVTFTASTVSAAGSAPGGSVNFFDGATQIGTAALSSSGLAVFSTSSLSVGSHSITASFAGDSANATSTSAPLVEIITTAQTVTALSATPAAAIAGTPVTLTAVVSGATGAVTLSGQVTFTDAGTVIGSGKLDSNDTTTASVVFTPGAHTIGAAYSGNSNAGASSAAPLPLTVSIATTQVTLTSSAPSVQVLTPVTFNVKVTGNGGMPTGSVAFAVDAAAPIQVPLGTNAMATFTESGFTPGKHTVTATYSGDTDDLASSASASETVTAIATVTSLAAALTGGQDPQTVLVATEASASGPTPTGTITFMNGASPVGSATLDATGLATFVPSLPAGTYSITASYGGDAVHSPSVSAPVSITGTAAAFSVAASTKSLTVAPGGSQGLSIVFVSSNGFSDTIETGCLGLPALVTCQFASDTLHLKAGQTQTAQLVVIAGAGIAQNAPPRAGAAVLASIVTPAGFLLVALLCFRRRKAAAWWAVLLLSLGVALSCTACGTITTAKATPGTYTIQVGGRGLQTGLTEFQTITLTIH